MKKNLYSALVAVAGGVGLVGAPASMAADGLPDGLSISTKFSQNFQDVDSDLPGGGSGQEHSFEFPRVALDINAQFTPWLSVYTEFTNEQSDFEGATLTNDVVNDLTLINVDLLKASDSAAADNNSLTLQFGTPVGGLSNYFNASDGALTQTNPLIGNHPYRPIDAMTGAKLIGSHNFGGVVKSFSWDAGYYTGAFFPSRGDDRGESFNLRGKLAFAGGFSAGVGYVDAEDNSAFFNSNNGPFNVNGNFNTHIGVGGGGNPDFTTAAQGWRLEGQWKAPSGMMLEGSKINAWYGEVESDDENLTLPSGNTVESELENWGVLAQAYVVPDTAYLAARYQLVEHTSGNVSNNNELDRFQIGGGVWLSDNTLLKAEYFDQSEEAFASSAAGGGEDFDGFGVELSSSF
jgi:hypothetical protein